MSGGPEDGGGERPFKVSDRRVSAAEPEPAGAAESAPPAEPELPVDFNTFVLSLGTGALIHLGAVAGAGNSTQTNLPLAKQTIDLLALLETKTAGNLTGEEERILSEILFDLRMRYVKLAKEAK